MQGLTRAPEIDRPGFEWFNVSAPLRLADLRGRMVILDFWTFCCVNCLHVVPTLSRLEQAFPDELVVIGVHSPKFPAERDGENLRHAIARCGVRHPVIQDPQMVLWREYCVKAWPTLIFIAPDGRVFGSLSGEPDSDKLIAGVGAMLREWRDAGFLAKSPLPFDLLEETGGRLRFPGKIKSFHGAGRAKRWAVADSGHHQIVLFDDDGAELRRFGSGQPGLVDCGERTSAFNAPQGLICSDRHIFVADTGNHAIRRIDAETGETVTLAGTGARGCALPLDRAPGHETALASVWDLERAGTRLFFANAGTHQIGELDLTSLEVRALAGSSAEDILDGPAGEANLAQPSGLACDESGRILYFTDSETSAIRALSLDGTPKVETLVGTGLFDFGCDNGPFGQALFQHPLGVACRGGGLVVADSYNGKLRLLDLQDRQVSDLEEGTFCCGDGPAFQSGEPAGVAADGVGRLLMTDTNNHRIVEIRPEQRSLRIWAS